MTHKIRGSNRKNVTYSTKSGKSRLDFSARWIHDFDVRKRVEGDGFNFSAILNPEHGRCSEFSVRRFSLPIRPKSHC